jgi:hypothetical protein
MRSSFKSKRNQKADFDPLLPFKVDLMIGRKGGKAVFG